MDVSQLSDAQLRDELKNFGLNLGPIVGTTRTLYEKKLIEARKKGSIIKKATPAVPSKSPRSGSRGRNAAKSEVEDESDAEVRIPPPARKPLTSTPDKSASKKPTTSRIPAASRSPPRSVSQAQSPGHTPPRRSYKTVAPTPSAALNVSSFSASRSRGLLDEAPSSGEEIDDHEESSRILPMTADYSGGVKRRVPDSSNTSLLGYFQKKPTLKFDEQPLRYYEMQSGGTRTRVAKDGDRKTYKISQTAESQLDAARLFLVVICAFIFILFCCYLWNAKSTAIVGTARTFSDAGRDTLLFVYSYGVLPVMVVLGAGAVAVALYWAYHQRKKWTEAEHSALCSLVQQITDRVREASEAGEETVSIPHIRDYIFTPAKREGADMARWERAVEWINEKESRIITESRLVRGVEVASWKWVGSANRGWQGAAFARDNAASSHVPVSKCLKVRNLVSAAPHAQSDEEVKEHVLAKVRPFVPREVRVVREEEGGVTYIQCFSKEDAHEIFKALHGMWYNGVLVRVKYIRDSRYAERFA